MTPEIIQNQWTITNYDQDTYLLTWIEAFLVDRRAQNLADGTLYFYRAKLQLFTDFCNGQQVSQIDQVDAGIIRRYLLHLEESGHNAGGCHAAYRALKTFLNWWEAELEPDNWKNPIRKVKAPKVPEEPLEPVELETVHKLITTCSGGSFMAMRDKALLLFLLDTGCRAAEVCAVDLADVDVIAGGVLIRKGKGRKPRTVFLGQKARRSLRAYLKKRSSGLPALWVTDQGGRLSYWGLNEIIRRRAAAAGVNKPGLHDFRRAFALNFLRNGGDIYSLQKLMGHADLQVLRRYLAQSDQDLKEAHQKGSPVDHAEW